MALLRLLVPALAIFAPEVLASELELLDRAGRLIAEKPCQKPKVSIKVEKNIHDESVADRFITQRCPGAGSEIVRSSASQYKHVHPLFASISQRDSRLRPTLQTGTLLPHVKSRLGLPEVEKHDSKTYVLPDESLEERVTFVHDGTRVLRIQWSWYFD